jgi:hypothetical protein
MKLYAWMASLALFVPGGQVISFDSSQIGRLPAGWTVAGPHQGGPPRWEIVKDVTAPAQACVFAQMSSDPASGRYPLAIFNGVSLRDGDISVRVKPVGGREDQAGGLVWRYRDENNYYLVRADAFLKTVAVFKVLNGRYIALTPYGSIVPAEGVHHDIPSRAWSILKVSVHGTQFDVYVNHRRILRVDDGTFSRAGKVGLWTRADSVVYFDDLRVSPR